MHKSSNVNLKAFHILDIARFKQLAESDMEKQAE